MSETKQQNQDNTSIFTPPTLINETIEKVKAILDKHFPEHLSFANGQFTLPFGSTQLVIIVRPFTDDDTCVECMSQLVTGANIDLELTKYLLRKNAELHYGAFGLLFDDTITFSHAITGANLDENELLSTINSVATISDYYDDIIVDMAGGKRAIDLLNEELT